jgi:hypothetical protein
MRELKLKDTEGGVLIINMPESLREVTLETKIHFDVDREDVHEAMTNGDTITFLKSLSYALSRFFGVDINKFMSLDVSDIIFDEQSTENILYYLFKTVDALCNSQPEFKEGEDIFFEYKGVEFKIPHIIKTLFNGKQLMSKINTYQAIEILEIVENIKKIPNLKDKKDIEDSLYVSYLKVLSVITLTDDEIIERKSIEERMDFFKEIDAYTAMHVYFFLSSTLTSSLKEMIASSISNLRRTLL